MTLTDEEIREIMALASNPEYQFPPLLSRDVIIIGRLLVQSQFLRSQKATYERYMREHKDLVTAYLPRYLAQVEKRQRERERKGKDETLAQLEAGWEVDRELYAMQGTLPITPIEAANLSIILGCIKEIPRTEADLGKLMQENEDLMRVAFNLPKRGERK